MFKMINHGLFCSYFGENDFYIDFSGLTVLGIYNFVCAFTGAETTFGPFVLFSSTTEQTNLMIFLNNAY